MTNEQLNVNWRLANSVARELNLSAQGIAIFVDSEGHYHMRGPDAVHSLLAESSRERLVAHAKGFADNLRS